MSGPSRLVLGAQHTLKDIENIFSGGVWPKLASWSPEDSLPLLLSDLPTNGQYKSIFPQVSARMMPISHGNRDASETYESVAYFIRHDSTAREFLFFGDVEPDSVSSKPQNGSVWRAAAEKIPHVLDTVFIECSWPSGRNDDQLYGHLSPEHLSIELTTLATEVIKFRTRTETKSDFGSDDEATRSRKRQRRESISPVSLRGALSGLRVFVIHCKDDLQNKQDGLIRQTIAAEVRSLVEAQDLGLEVIAVEPGIRICMCTSHISSI
ncbi:uncharacterized protein FIBRA_05991 [Fibroporia radiculosa]|uniref:Uncharacterized protein n=1 Tax=Fibroporia radiculosa TaxID=599839 RepID=J4HYE7_9APHY|nr:uncharacterized protein FIBRA_05991 [Fibroporia radiculosa]CCM03842.1 predicted protein [Fibroporia radiculosa]